MRFWAGMSGSRIKKGEVLKTTQKKTLEDSVRLLLGRKEKGEQDGEVWRVMGARSH